MIRAASLPELVRTRLAAALDLRLRRMDLQRTDAFRWVHGEADRLPGLHVDLYARRRGRSLRRRGRPRLLPRTCPGVCWRWAGRWRLRAVVDRDRRGEGPSGELEVREEGLRFGVDLERGQKGGLFLDQRENRVEVGRRARGNAPC